MSVATASIRQTPEFQQSELGLLPSDWRVEKLKNICRPVRGGSPRPAGDPRFFNGNFIPWLTVAALTNIPQERMVVMSTVSSLTEEGSLRSRTLKAGTLIIANSGATLGVAKMLGIRCCANDGIAALLDLSDEFSPEFLIHYINSRIIYLREVVARGNGQPNLNTTLIGEFLVPVPSSRREQRAIATALSDSDGLIEALERLIAKKRAVKQGAMQELLSARTRFPGFSGEWRDASLGDIAQLYQPMTISARHLTKEGFPVYGANGVIGFFDKANHGTDQVTITCRGSTCGTVNLAHGPSWITGNSMVVNVDGQVNVNKAFLLHLLCAQDFTICITGTGQPQIVRSALRDFSLKLPSLTEQQATVDVLADLDSELQALTARLAKARAIKQGMMQELLTGRIRLV